MKLLIIEISSCKGFGKVGIRKLDATQKPQKLLQEIVSNI